MDISLIILLGCMIVAALVNNKVLHYILTPLILMRTLYMLSWGIFTIPYWVYIKYNVHDLIFAICLLIGLLFYYYYLRKWTITATAFINRDHLKVAKISLIISYAFAIIYCILLIAFNLNMHLISWVCCLTSIISYSKTLFCTLTLNVD
jgi:hypothetical protein